MEPDQPDTTAEQVAPWAIRDQVGHRRVVVRAVARVPRSRHPGAGTRGRAIGPAPGRDVGAARRRPVGVARIPTVRESTRRLTPSAPAPAPVFVDDTGRRRRLVTVVASAVVLLVLALIAAFWLSQVARL
jgi:hypothetical protein